MPRRMSVRSRLPTKGAADAPSCSCFAGWAAVPLCALLHATDVSDLPGAGGRAGLPDRAADGVRDAGRRRGCLGRGIIPVHRFFSKARWQPDKLGLLVATVIVGRLLDPDAAILVAIDDSLLHRRGRRVYGCFYHHDATANIEKAAVACGNNWVVAGIVGRLPFLARPVCLPVLFRPPPPRPPAGERKRGRPPEGPEAAEPRAARDRQQHRLAADHRQALRQARSARRAPATVPVVPSARRYPRQAANPPPQLHTALNGWLAERAELARRQRQSRPLPQPTRAAPQRQGHPRHHHQHCRNCWRRRRHDRPHPAAHFRDHARARRHRPRHRCRAPRPRTARNDPRLHPPPA